MNFGSTQHSSSKLGSAFVCTKFLIFSFFQFLIFSIQRLCKDNTKKTNAIQMRRISKCVIHWLMCFRPKYRIFATETSFITQTV